MKSSSKQFKKRKFIAAFTLIEMVVVIGIFVIVTGIILANLPSYRSSSSLDLVAQEVATQVRGAQVYAMSTVVGNTTGNIFGYLLSVPTSGKDFKLCACKTLNNYSVCVSECNSNPANVIESYHLSGKVNFKNTTNINLYFKRPMGSLLCETPSCDNLYSIIVWDGVNSRQINVGNSGNISINNP